jgi:L-fucose mutarotase
MLKGRLLHPELVKALAAAGHGAKVLLADGNYPVSTKTPPGAARIYLNLAPGIVTVTDVLAVLVESIPIEAAEVMVPDAGPEPPIFEDFRRLLRQATTMGRTGGELPLRPLSRQAFYAAASSEDVAVAVATGERRVYANLLLTIGVVSPDDASAGSR